ncbi:hypothetical protein [Paenibacillus periandrae]|uniref:hypothetical protein n=1 Tax=Paenibacillus periandrae TaxID=1761741 RepID=UPI001F09345D|nr:hypothetical protein [Paenibacillus periandrae]
MNDTINANKWIYFKKDVHGLEVGEERVWLVDGKAVVVKLAEVADLDRINRGVICID